MFVVGKKADGKVMFYSGKYGGCGNPPDSTILDEAIARFGGTKTDYAILPINDSSADAERVYVHDTFDLTWDGSTPTGVSFAKEDAKEWFTVSTDKTTIKADGIDEATITVTLKTCDKLGTTSKAATGTKQFPIAIPKTVAKKTVTFKDGVIVLKFKTKEPGTYKIPSSLSKFDPDLRIENQVTIEAETTDFI